jgi:Flp pilus assembly CpaF family ATPase
LVAQLRAQASERLSDRHGADRLSREEQKTLGGEIIADIVAKEATATAARGAGVWDQARVRWVEQAVFDALFRLGRLQPLVDDPTVENIMISGADQVWLEDSNGTVRPGPPVADSDTELIEHLVFLASHSEVNARTFSEANPRLHLKLDGGARLAAVAWVTPRPAVVIRRHRLRRVTLGDLVQRNSLTETMASFLAAAVKARKSIVVSGGQGAGKTTLLRALCAEIPRWEALGTFETEYELGLHELTEDHPIVVAWEARPGTSEVGAHGGAAGQFTVDDALYDSFRFNLSRQIVGEVRGREVLAMIKAMQSGAGSLSTTHASSAEAAVRKLITCAMEAGPHATVDYATRVIAEDIDLIVHADMEVTKDRSGGFKKTRWVSEIIEVTPGESAFGYATTPIFSTPPGARQARANVLPDHWRSLSEQGFSLERFYQEAGA